MVRKTTEGRRESKHVLLCVPQWLIFLHAFQIEKKSYAILNEKIALLSLQPYTVARWEGLRQMRKTARPHARSAARSYNMNMKRENLYKIYTLQNGFQAVSYLQI